MLLTARTFPGDNSPGVCRTAELLASGIVDLKIGPVKERVFAEAGGSGNVPMLGRSLFIQKMRGTRLALVERPFDILDDRGLVLREPD
jgi:hypothetical protein